MVLNYSDDITLAELARLLAEEEKSTNGKIDSEEDRRRGGTGSFFCSSNTICRRDGILRKKVLSDCMRYGSVARKVFKTRWGLYNKGLVEDHHVIPREFREHPTIKGFRYDMNAGDNVSALTYAVR